MSKLTLKIESLEVESFDTAGAGAAERGTVHAASPVLVPDSQAPETMCLRTCHTGPCCEYTFAYSCNHQTLCCTEDICA